MQPRGPVKETHVVLATRPRCCPQFERYLIDARRLPGINLIATHEFIHGCFAHVLLVKTPQQVVQNPFTHGGFGHVHLFDLEFGKQAGHDGKATCDYGTAIANDPRHLGGAIDAEAAEKAGRFLQLADAFDLPVISLCDTPGFMVGPQAEQSATVRRVSRMFVTAASMTVPVFTVVLRKGYGLGAQAMAAGSFATPFFTIAWPSGEFGAMGIEGSVRLGFRKELEAIADPVEREAYFQKMVAQAYENGKALNMATHLEIDDVIDPADTRSWVVAGLRSLPPTAPRTGKKRAWVDTW